MLANLAAQDTQGLDDTYHVMSYSWEALGSTCKGESGDLWRIKEKQLPSDYIHHYRKGNVCQLMEIRPPAGFTCVSHDPSV